MMDLRDMYDPTLLLNASPKTDLDAMDDGSCGPSIPTHRAGCRNQSCMGSGSVACFS